jgi:hypothetical protein
VARLLRLAHSTPLDTLLDDALAGGITLLAADLGNLQLLDPATRRLRIAAQRGFGSEFLTHFADVDDASTACGRALRAGV